MLNSGNSVDPDHQPPQGSPIDITMNKDGGVDLRGVSLLTPGRPVGRRGRSMVIGSTGMGVGGLGWGRGGTASLEVATHCQTTVSVFQGCPPFSFL